MGNVLLEKINHEDPSCRFSMSSVEASGSAEVEKTIFFSGVEQEEPTTADGLEDWNRQDNQQFSSQLQICKESPFTMRSFVLAVRHKDIKKTWPFPQKHLQRWLDKGREPVLPPLQSPRKVADATVAATPIQDNDLELQICQEQTGSLKMGHDQHAKHAEKTSEPIQIIKGYSSHRKDLGFGCQTKRLFHKILRKTRSQKLKPEILHAKKIEGKTNHEKEIEEKDNLLQTSLAYGDLTTGSKWNGGLPEHCESGDTAQVVEPVADKKIDEKGGLSQDVRTEDAPASEPTRFVPKLGPSRKHKSKLHKLRIADGLKIKHVSNKSTKQGIERLKDGSTHKNTQSQEMGDLNGIAAANLNTKNNRRLEDILRGEGQLMEDLHAKNRIVSEIAAKDSEECCEKREISNGEIKANHIEIAKRSNECGIGVSENLVPKVCPVCLSFSSTSNTALNAHIDHCLTAEPAPNRVPVKSPKYKMRTQKIRSIADICGSPPSKDHVIKCASVDPLLTRKQINSQKLKLVIEKRHGIVKTCHMEAYSGRKHETSYLDHEDETRKQIHEPFGGKEKPKKSMRLDHIEHRQLTDVPSQQPLTLNFKPRHAMTLKIGEVNMVDKNTRDFASEQDSPSMAPIILKKRRCGSRKKKDVSKIILAMQAVGSAAEQKSHIGNLDLSDANEDKCASVLTNSNCTSSLDSSCSMLEYNSSENYSGSGSLHEAWLPPKGILQQIPLTGKNVDLEDIQSAQRRVHGKGNLKTRSMDSRRLRDAIHPKDHHEKTSAVIQKQNSSSKHIARKDRFPPVVPVSKRKFSSRVNDQSLETPPKKYKASFSEKLCRLDNWKKQSELCKDGNIYLPSKKKNDNVDDISSDNHSSSSNIHRGALHGQAHTKAATLLSGVPERSKASRKSAPLPRGPGGRFISINSSASLADLKSLKKASPCTMKVKSSLYSPPSVLINDLRSFSCDDNRGSKDESESDQEKGLPSSDVRENITETLSKGCSNDEVVQSSIHPGSLVQGTPITCRALSATPSILPDESGASRLTVREEQVDKSNANGDSMFKSKVITELTQRPSGILSREILEQQLGMNHNVDKSLWQRQGTHASSSESFMCSQVNGHVGNDFAPWSINGPFQNQSAIDCHRQNEMITSNSTTESNFHASTLPGWMRTAVCEQPGSSGILYNEMHGNERCYLEGCMQSKTTSDIYDSDKPILRLMGKNVLLSPREQTPSHMIQRNRGPEEVFPNSYKFSELLLDSTSDFPYATREPRSRQFVQNDQNPQSSVVYSQTVREADLVDMMSLAENTTGSAVPTMFKNIDLKFQGVIDGGTLSAVQKPKHVDEELPPTIFFSEPVKEYPRSSGWYAVDEQSLLQKPVEALATYSYQSVKNMPENLPSFVVSNRPVSQCSNLSFNVESQNAESQVAAMKEYGSRNFQLLNGTYDGMDITRLSRNFPSHNLELHSHYIQPERVEIRGQSDAMIERRQACMASQSQCLPTIREDPFTYMRSHAEVMASTVNGSVASAKLTGLAMLPSLGNYNLLSSHNF